MKVAAYQAPLHAVSSPEILGLIREQIDGCETNSVEILCCPEGVLGGLADYASRPTDIALDVEAGQLHALLAPLASDKVATILGFTEIDRGGRLYNSAAVWHKGSVVGLYRKLYPAINKSLYAAGDKLPIFTVGDLTFGIIICNDSNYPDLGGQIAARGAAALFIPTNNGLPNGRASLELNAAARITDITLADKVLTIVVEPMDAARRAALLKHLRGLDAGGAGTDLAARSQ